jgi:hypothetical protein
LPFLKIGEILDNFHISGNLQVLRARLNTNCKGYARTEAQSFKRNAGILSGPAVNLGLSFFRADVTSDSDMKGVFTLLVSG